MSSSNKVFMKKNMLNQLFVELDAFRMDAKESLPFDILSVSLSNDLMFLMNLTRICVGMSG